MSANSVPPFITIRLQQRTVTLGKTISTGAHGEIHECWFPTIDDDTSPKNRTSSVAKVVFSQTSEDALNALKAAEMIQSLPPHKNVIRYHVVLRDCPVKNAVTVVMPRFQANLERYISLNTQPIPERSVLHIAQLIADGLLHLHQSGVVHGDLSLRNVVVDDATSAEPNVCIIDLEEAFYVGSSSGATSNVQRRYTEEYAGRERCQGIVSRAADVFALGVMLYVLASKRAPEFPGLVSRIPGIGNGFFNVNTMTPARLAAVVHRDVAYPDLALLVTSMLDPEFSNRITMREVRDVLSFLSNNGHLGFPTCMRPIVLQQVAPSEAASKVRIYDDSLAFDLDWPCVSCRRKVHQRDEPMNRTFCKALDDLHLPGSMSPPSTNWGLCLGKGRGHCHFVHPVRALDVRSCLTEPFDLLQLHGGFMTTHSVPSGAVIDLRVLMDAASTSSRDRWANESHPQRMVLSAAQPWPPECTDQLHRTSRIRHILPRFLLKQQTDGHPTPKAFSWILPMEEFTLTDGRSWIPAEEGAFVFWFSTEPLMNPHRWDRMFTVAPPVEDWSQPALGAEPSGDRRSFTGIIRNLFSSASRRTPRPTEGSPRPLEDVDISFFGCYVPLELIDFGSSRSASENTFVVPSTGEAGSLSHPFHIDSATAERLQLPTATVQLSVLKTVGRGSGSNQLFPHHGLIGWDSDMKSTGAVALRVNFTPQGAGPPTTLFEIPTADAGYTEHYHGITDPLWLPPQEQNAAFLGVSSDEGRAIRFHIRLSSPNAADRGPWLLRRSV